MAKINETKTVDLGCLEETDAWKLQSIYFPSKVGGKPAWLDLYNLPNKILCLKCNKQCIFLCQIYAPIEDKETCFHRTIFVFFCKDPVCCQQNVSDNFKVFRCQLSRVNQFYSSSPPVEDMNWKPDIVSEQCSLCCVCGAKGPSRCGKCKSVFYCSKDHQVLDWKSYHKQLCTTGPFENTDSKIYDGLLLPQFEIVIEPEDYLLEDNNDAENRSEEQKLQEYKQLVDEGKAGTLQGDASVDEDLQKMAESNEDKQFSKFSKIIKRNPDQVLRYERRGSPLWISLFHIPTENSIPCCEYCGAARQFEFQILPQMLNYLGLDTTSKSIDWGVLAVYTCSDSCDVDPVYKEEFLWKQDIIAT